MSASGNILGYPARIAVAATILTCLFSFCPGDVGAQLLCVAVAVFALGAVVLTQVTASSVESASYPLVFPVYYSLMLLVMISIHTLQLALSLRGETALLIQR